MSSRERSRFLRRYWPLLLLGNVVYIGLTAFRSYRDFFAPEIYGAILGRAPAPADYLLIDWPGGVLVVILLGTLGMVGDSRRALLLIVALMFAGASLILVSTLAYGADLMAALTWCAFAAGGLYVRARMRPPFCRRAPDRPHRPPTCPPGPTFTRGCWQQRRRRGRRPFSSSCPTGWGTLGW